MCSGAQYFNNNIRISQAPTLNNRAIDTLNVLAQGSIERNAQSANSIRSGKLLLVNRQQLSDSNTPLAQSPPHPNPWFQTKSQFMPGIIKSKRDRDKQTRFSKTSIKIPL